MTADPSQLLSSALSVCTWDASTWQTWAWAVRQRILTLCVWAAIPNRVGDFYISSMCVSFRRAGIRRCPGPWQCPPTRTAVLCLNANVVLFCALEPPRQSHPLGVEASFAYQRALLEMHKSQISGPRWLMVGLVAANPWISFLKKSSKAIYPGCQDSGNSGRAASARLESCSFPANSGMRVLLPSHLNGGEKKNPTHPV